MWAPHLGCHGQIEGGAEAWAFRSFWAPNASNCPTATDFAMISELTSRADTGTNRSHGVQGQGGRPTREIHNRGRFWVYLNSDSIGRVRWCLEGAHAHTMGSVQKFEATNNPKAGSAHVCAEWRLRRP